MQSRNGREPTNQVIVIVDNGQTDRLTKFTGCERTIRADRPDEMGAALAAIEAAVASGRTVAGFASYELGYLLEPRLLPLLPRHRSVPLLLFGVFERAEVHASGAAFLETQLRGRAYAGPLAHEWDETAYDVRFRRVHALIAAGDIYQANLSLRSRFAFAGDSLALYASLRRRSGAAHCAYLDDGERQILSLSPELFFAVSPERRITAKPMKGTAARGHDTVSDAAARAHLRASDKERAENLMIVDLLRNDIGRIAKIGTVAVDELFAIETYPTVHQMVSTITAELKPNVAAPDILRALFPCGSITGAPKIRAMEIIRELESSARGVYCGAIGYFAPDGSAEFNVAIRTLTIANGRGELGIGGAVVHDSRAAFEYAECLLKARYYETARQPLELIETLRWSPEDGFARQPRHLARMSASADVFGIPFDETAARHALADAVANATATQRVRLTLAENGQFAAAAQPLRPAAEKWRYTISPIRVSSADLLQNHKTSWRELYEAEYARAAALGCDEVLFLNERGELTEGSRSNLFLQIDGRLVTPAASCGLLPGCLRQELIESRDCSEGILLESDLRTARAVYLGNSLRGLIPAKPGTKDS
ncbi:MAG TPA: aminodeoxychorismate synthase component I [Rhizomicrobium sp.]|jgi:para-aminobenzoate synthetase/4-amino-4-deoxychorismate lyase